MNQELRENKKKHSSSSIVHSSSKSRGFTLVELLVVMAIISILVTLIASGFRTAQMRGRDAQRKADLKNIANSLELFLSDYGKYPADTGNFINGCPYDPTSGNGSPCNSGNSEFTDGKTVYFKKFPQDPDSGQPYRYRIVPNSNSQKFQVFAHLENPQDQDCIGGSCTTPTGVPGEANCGTSAPCNFAITSSNTTPTEN
jgi:general secretion pathway protein G